jgi:hypothetical protein
MLLYNQVKGKQIKQENKQVKENKIMKKLNRELYKVIDEFDCDITTIVNVFENDGKLFVIDEFDLDITKRVKVIRK